MLNQGFCTSESRDIYTRKVGGNMDKLHKKLNQLTNDTLINKKYLVSENIDLQLQQFCLKNQVKQSDALALAISELIEKYSDHDNRGGMLQ